MTFPAFIITNNIGAILLQMGVPPGAPTLQDGGIGVGGLFGTPVTSPWTTGSD